MSSSEESVWEPRVYRQRYGDGEGSLRRPYDYDTDEPVRRLGGSV